MVQSAHLFATALALAVFGLAFVAAWFEPKKRTPGTLLGIFGLGLLTYSTSPGTINSIVYSGTISISDSFSLVTGIRLAGIIVAALGVLMYSRRSVVINIPDSPIKRMLDSKSLDLHNARNIAESMLKSALGAKIVLSTEKTPSGPIYTVRMVNGSIEQLFGAPSSKLVNNRLERVCPEHLYPWLARLATQATETNLPCQDERRFDGKHTQWYELRAVSFPSGVTINISDITDRRRIEDALRREAMTDPLTGLANRSQLKSTLAEVVHRTSIRAGRGLSLFYIDFDRFKVINDSLGHDIGDELLCSIASRLRAAVQSLSIAKGSKLAARLGGDEFVVLAEGMFDKEQAEAFAAELVSIFAEPHKLGLHSVISTASIGIAVDEGDCRRAEDILRDADMAMYSAKESGKDRFVIFDESLRERALSEATLENDLRVAVEKEEFGIAFQPIIDLRTGDVHSFEALIRWIHPQRGYITPEQFIPLAEELGLIEQIGEQVLRRSCFAAKALQEITKTNRPISVSVNHSKLELLSGRFVDNLAAVIHETGIDASFLKIEVTESVCVKHQSAVVPVLNEIRALGVQAVIDDFGTGDSSFSCVEQFPLDQLKIDRRFLRSDRDDTTRRAILSTMIEMAQSLKVPAVCEGIETREELDLMLELGCDLGQGWVFAEAMPLDEALELAASGLSRWIENLPLLEAIEKNAKRIDRSRNAA
jgi:diguanylate cyclase (GGDEF)-like protein